MRDPPANAKDIFVLMLRLSSAAGGIGVACLTGKPDVDRPPRPRLGRSMFGGAGRIAIGRADHDHIVAVNDLLIGTRPENTGDVATL